MIEKEDTQSMINGTIASMTIGYGMKRNPYNHIHHGARI